MKEYLTVKEVAKYLKKHPATVRRLIRARKLKAQKLAGKYGVYIVLRSDILEYMMKKVIQDTSN